MEYPDHPSRNCRTFTLWSLVVKQTADDLKWPKDEVADKLSKKIGKRSSSNIGYLMPDKISDIFCEYEAKCEDSEPEFSLDEIAFFKLSA